MNTIEPVDDGVIDVAGCTNFRDAGGWSTPDGRRMRRGALYRSDDPVRLLPEGRAAVAALDIACVIDVRQAEQRGRGPGFVDEARTRHVPLVDRVIDINNPPPLATASDIADLYERMLSNSGDRFAEAVDLVAEHVGAGPVLVHCVYGKDRTGLIVALVQAAIGVPREAIVAEYHRSHEPTVRRHEWMMAEPLEGDPPVDRAPKFLFSATAETMECFLDRVEERHGTLDAWAASLPLAPDTIDTLRAHLLEDPED
jgi:protein-tyrosine phosphatase